VAEHIPVAARDCGERLRIALHHWRILVRGSASWAQDNTSRRDTERCVMPTKTVPGHHMHYTLIASKET